MAINTLQSITLIVEFSGYYKAVKFNYGNVNHIHFYLRLEKVLAKREISDGYHFSNILVQTKKKFFFKIHNAGRENYLQSVYMFIMNIHSIILIEL